MSAPPSPRRARVIQRTLILIIALLVLLVYLATAAPGAWWGDGQELACAAWTLGIPHPTGYPLYTICGHAVMKLLPFLDPGRALTIFSAVLLAGAVGLLIPFFLRVLALFNPQSAIRDPQLSWPHGPQATDGLLPAAGAGLLLAFSWTLWDHATFAEVYPLTFFIGAGVLALAWTPDEARPGAGRAAALGALMGLGMLNHYSILSLAPLAALTLLRWTLRAPRARWRLPLAAGLCFAVMLTGYLYLPLRAAANPPLNWGDPSNLARLKWVLTGGQFKERFFAATPDQLALGITTDALIARGITGWVRWWGTQWLPAAWMREGLDLALGIALIALAIFGLLHLSRRRWELGLGLLGAFGASFVYGALYHILDIGPYFLVALPAAMTGWIMAVAWLAQRLAPQAGRLAVLGRALPALGALALLAANIGPMKKTGDIGPFLYGSTVMKALPKDALVLTGADADIYSLWYQQMVLGQRPDVTVFGTNFLNSNWYRRYFERPERPKIPIYIEDRSFLETHQVTYNVKFFRGVLLPNLAQGRPVFATYQDPFLMNYLQPKPVAALLPKDYEFFCAYPYLPCPVLYRLQPNPHLATLNEAQLTQEFWQFFKKQRTTP